MAPTSSLPNLHLPDPAALVHFLRDLAGREGSVVLEAGSRRAIELADRLFVLDDASGLVSGPYEFMDELLDTTGRMEFRIAWSLQESGPEGAGDRTIYRWGNAFVAVDSEVGTTEGHDDLREAILSEEPSLWYTEGYYWITSHALSESEVLELLEEYPESAMREGQYLEINGARFDRALGRVG